MLALKQRVRTEIADPQPSNYLYAYAYWPGSKVLCYRNELASCLKELLSVKHGPEFLTGRRTCCPVGGAATVGVTLAVASVSPVLKQTTSGGASAVFVCLLDSLQARMNQFSMTSTVYQTVIIWDLICET